MDEKTLRNLFLGTKGENAGRLSELVKQIIDSAGEWRSGIFPDLGAETPDFAGSKPTPTVNGLLAGEGKGELERLLGKLLHFLQRSVPAFSPRYHAHMGFDLIFPGILGNLTGLLYPSNNVAYEGSPATTVLEMLACQDLCRMVGYPAAGEAGIKPWGHLVAGGTVANIEALWAARNLKYLPLSVRAALDAWTGDKTGLQGFTVMHAGRKKRFESLDTWELLNLETDEALDLPRRIKEEALKLPPRHQRSNRDRLSQEDFDSAINGYGVNQMGIQAFLGPGMAVPKILLSHDNHYSFEKAPALLGLGQDCLEFIEVDESGRMRMEPLKERLRHFLEKEIPVLAVIANLGSTELGAVDPLSEILGYRDEVLRPAGLDFPVHVDASFGGYHASMLRPDFPMGGAPAGLVPGEEVEMSGYVYSQFKALPRADSVTVDPHKLGFIPYPGGALCMRNSACRDLTRFNAPYLGAVVPQGIGQVGGNTDQFVGVYGVEGSRTGGSAAAVFLAHSLVRPSAGGYGILSTLEMRNSKRVFDALFKLNTPDQGWIVALAGTYPKAVRQGTGKPEADPAALKESGPDLNMLSYLFNFKDEKGVPNSDRVWLNVFNMCIYGQVDLNPREESGGEARPYARRRLIVSSNVFSGREGPTFVGSLLRKAGMNAEADSWPAESDWKGVDLFVLRSAEWHPWLDDAGILEFTGTLRTAADLARTAVLKAKAATESPSVAMLRDAGHSEFEIAVGIATYVRMRLGNATDPETWLGPADRIGESEIRAGWQVFGSSMSLPGLAERALNHFSGS